MRILGPLTAVLVLSACGTAPDLGDRGTEAAQDAPFPTLVATDPIVAAHGAPVVPGGPVATTLQAQAAALETRASTLQTGDVIDPEVLRRLRAAQAAAADAD